MKLLYSNILPLGTENDQETVTECFFEEFEQADHVEIASGYISKASLLELDALVESSGINKIIETFDCVDTAVKSLQEVC